MDSPSFLELDFTKKYTYVGVEDQMVNVWRLNEQGKYVPDQRPYVTGDVIRVDIFDDFLVAVDDVFEGLLDFDN